MKRVIGDRERAQRAAARLRVLQHFEQVSRNISRTCRFFGISRTLFYEWRRRYQRDGLEGLRPRLPGPRVSPFRTAPHIEALVLRVRQERQYGIPRLRLFLRRYHAVSLSPPTIRRILREHRVPRVSQKRYRPGPKRRPELRVPGQSVQVDVKHLKTQSGRLYQFTAIDEATRYRILKIYDHNSIQSAIHFINEVRQAFPAAIRRIQTDNGSEWGTDFTWHLHDLGIAHKHIPPGCPESNGKVERSHRTDEDEFYRRVTFKTRPELVRKLRAWEHEYNHRRLHLALGGKTPAERLAELRISPAVGVLRSA
jgi:transposase InsO family protein